jgi:hypothetical protein
MGPLVSGTVSSESAGRREGFREGEARVTTGKHRRSNEQRRNDARRLVRWWYGEMAREGRVQYLSDGQRRAITIPDDVGEGDALAMARKERPEHFRIRVDPKTGRRAELSATGVERRYIFPQGFDYPRAFGNVVDRERSPMLVVAIMNHATETMRHVAMMCYEARLVLEMEAATWTYDAIAAEIGCGEQMARQYFEAGLAHVISYRHLVKGATPVLTD